MTDWTKPDAYPLDVESDVSRLRASSLKCRALMEAGEARYADMIRDMIRFMSQKAK